jgi:thioredoxin-related protein
MKKSGLLWALVFLTLGAFGQSINWASSTDQGLVRAQREGKRTFLLITAPSWCSYCQVLERDVLSDAQIIAAINRDFVPVKILDTDSDIGVSTLPVFQPYTSSTLRVTFYRISIP